MTEFTCAHHTAEVYLRGGVTFVGDITPLAAVTWTRVRDDISTANVQLPPTECCDLLSELRSGYHELHILRDGEPVWEGVIVRIEYETDEVRVYAEDMMWVPKRTVLATGYSNAYPHIGYAIDQADWLIRQQCYNLNGDPWGMLPHLHTLSPLGTGPKTSRAVAAYEMTVWQDFDKYSEDHGLDYTVINREVYLWDHGLNWATLPDLSEDFLSESPRLVEYGNELYTRAYVSNARGFAGIATAPSPWPETYGYIESLSTNIDDSGDLTDKLHEQQDEVAKIEDQIEDANEQFAEAIADYEAKGDIANYERAKADLKRAQSDQQDAKVDNLQFLANEWQRWADQLQTEASDTGNKDLNDTAKAAQKGAETAARNAEEKRELALRQEEVATTARTVANISGSAADDTYADTQEALLTTMNADYNTALAQANTAQANADSAWAAAKATNDAGKQNDANTVQAGADAAEADVRSAKLTAVNMSDAAKAQEKVARDAETEEQRAFSTAASWRENAAQLNDELDWAINGRHGVPDKEDKDGLNDIIAEINAAIVVWKDTAQRSLVGHAPAPLGIVVPANTTLLPGSGWTINDLIPGGQFLMSLERLCRQVTNVMMINEIRVEEAAPDGEQVQLTADSIGIV